MLLHVEVPSVIFSWRPYLCKNLVSMEESELRAAFGCVFARDVAACRSIFTREKPSFRCCLVCLAGIVAGASETLTVRFGD